MAGIFLELLCTAFKIWLAANFTLIVVMIAHLVIDKSETAEVLLKAGGEFLWIKCPLAMFVLYAIHCSLKFLGG